MSAGRRHDPLQDAVGRIADAGGLGLTIVRLDRSGWDEPSAVGAGVVKVGVDRAGLAPPEGLDGFDILLSADPAAPFPWVGLPGERLDAAIAEIEAVVARQPVAAAVAAEVCRMTLSLPFEEALVLESLAYSMLLASGGFLDWRTANPPRSRPSDDGPRVSVNRLDGALHIRLSRPSARNAVDARMRDEWVEALEFAQIDPDRAPVILSGEGPDFCSGGDLDEFGSASDPGEAHAIRTLRSAARAVHALGPRISARLHGACIGAGIEVPAAAARVTARPGTIVRLPEVSMGLIPGAGGMASIPRRVGRHRACYMAITGCPLDADTALAWGLIDSVDAEP